MATQGTWFHLSARAATAAAQFPTCPIHRAHMLSCQTHSHQEWNSLLATVAIRQQAVHNMAMVESELLGKLVCDALITFCHLLCAVSGFWGVTGGSALYCRCGKAAFGCRISGSLGDISVFAELEASLIALMDLRMTINFPLYFLFDFSCSFAKQFKVGKMTASVWFKRLLQSCGFPARVT